MSRKTRKSVIFDTARITQHFFTTIHMGMFLAFGGWVLCAFLTVEATAAGVTQDAFFITNLMISDYTGSDRNLSIPFNCHATPDASQTVYDFVAPKTTDTKGYLENENVSAVKKEVWGDSFSNTARYDPSTWPLDSIDVWAHSQGDDPPGLNLHLPTRQVQRGESVSLLLHKKWTLPNPGWRFEEEVLVDGNSIVIDLLPVEPPVGNFYASYLADLHLPIVLEDLDSGDYSVQVNWHSPWHDGDYETVTGHFLVVPEPTTLLLAILSLVAVLLRVRRG